MRLIPFIILFLFFVTVTCKRSQPVGSEDVEIPAGSAYRMPAVDYVGMAGKGALLLTRFKSLEELKKIVQIKYVNRIAFSNFGIRRLPGVCLTHYSDGRKVTSTLMNGVSEKDFLRTRSGKIWDKIRIVFLSPYAVINRNELVSVEIFGRRRYQLFGEGDISFYDLAERMMYNISEEDLAVMPPEDFSEKGYLNTFNHVIAQSFMTTLFSEELADYIADVHELNKLPELVTGDFSKEQILNLDEGPVDNYLDMINNEWGQELGKILKKKYAISGKTHWTPELLANYLNDLQDYHSWSFQIGFKPFSPQDDMIIRFSNKINQVLNKLKEFSKHYY